MGICGGFRDLGLRLWGLWTTVDGGQLAQPWIPHTLIIKDLRVALSGVRFDPSTVFFTVFEYDKN